MGAESLLFSAKSSFSSNRQLGASATLDERRRGWARELDVLEGELEALERSREQEYSTALGRVGQLELRAATPQAYGHLLSGRTADLRELLEEFEEKLAQERVAQGEFQDSVRGAVVERLRRAEEELQAEHQRAMEEATAVEKTALAALEQRRGELTRADARQREGVERLACEGESAFAQLDEQIAVEAQAVDELEAEVQQTLLQLEERLTGQLSGEQAVSDDSTNELLGLLEEALARLEGSLR